MKNLDLATYNLAIDPLRDQLISLQESESLFSTEDKIELLNDIAGVFFNKVFILEHQSQILNICRMTDRAETPVKGGAKKENLTIKNMLERPNVKALVEFPLLEALSLQIHDRVESERFRRLRNEYISHLDLKFMQDLQGADILGPNKGQITEITSLIYDFYSLLGSSLFGGVGTKLPSKGAGAEITKGAGTLIIKLRDYQRYKQVLKEVAKVEGVSLKGLVDKYLQ